jgi:hypothetical protein
MRLSRSLAVALTCALALTGSLAGSAQAQDRTLSWPDVAVTAHLDADGVLHVSERQRMRFTGEWNGGERRFNVKFAQRFEFERLVRLDSAGSVHAMVPDDLDVVDGYSFTDSRTLRWRSRTPDDPPFDNTTLTFQLDFSYRGILDVVKGGTYRLNHDFAFADRVGAFEHFSLDLTIDSAWGVPRDFTGHYEANNLEPGYGYVVTVPLTRVSAVPPAQVRLGAPMPVRVSVLALLVAGLGVIVWRAIALDARRGRFAPLPSPDAITEEWLEHHVFTYLPEVVGAAWDRRTAEPEVAATLARLVQEGKLRSRVESSKILMFDKHVLHLELTTSRDKLRAHERTLIDALFRSKEQTTDTDTVRKRYSKTGFNPASLIRSTLDTLVERAAPSDATEDTAVSGMSTLMLLGAALTLLALGMSRDLIDGLITGAAVALTVPFFLVARGFAAVWKHRVYRLWPIGGVLLALIVVGALAFAKLLVFGDSIFVGWLVLAGLACWGLALTNSVANEARLAESPERVALRQRFGAAREFFRRELATREPRLKDAWYPYMLAFGLGKHVDRWFKSFGGVSSSSLSSSTIATSSNFGSSSSGGGAMRFGGGGGFAGAGGGMDFGAAISGIASSVPSPSSSSSGSSSSSSSSSSSGGGGGGGW